MLNKAYKAYVHSSKLAELTMRFICKFSKRSYRNAILFLTSANSNYINLFQLFYDKAKKMCHNQRDYT